MTGPQIKTESGSGGRKGHSNMEHWSKTEFIKRMARKARRRQDKQAAKEES